MKNFLSGLLLIAAITLTSCFAHYDESTETKIPQSVIVLISDGTGISQITALRYSRDDFAFFRFPVVGLFTTHALDQLITDSAA
ncbi:MAG: alkaline phosphatase, partial [candidate division Zixibacteria bacterium]|nr:alkaline phosphatase [Gammaproteobacteria bacterium]NIR49509.1 alkaline phosphatase [candidate division KSB1 bacterium]NIV06659.1 alkaline phosphatase [candidate division Zixibacteria bacterium]NIS24945.1 alkaline phosphatase [candidate division KSB1 bacterium]NIT71865.1 alkaline phosphatase [candidate division KSB1 bacterium]